MHSPDCRALAPINYKESVEWNITCTCGAGWVIPEGETMKIEDYDDLRIAKSMLREFNGLDEEDGSEEEES